MCKGKWSQAHAHTCPTHPKLKKGVKRQLIPHGLGAKFWVSQPRTQKRPRCWRQVPEGQVKMLDSSTMGVVQRMPRGPRDWNPSTVSRDGVAAERNVMGGANRGRNRVSQFLQSSRLLEPVYIGKSNKVAGKGGMLRTKEQGRERWLRS